MRRAAWPAIALAGATAALATPASAADTVARAEHTAGPVLAGSAVAWADRTRSGAPRVLTGRPGSRPVVVQSWAAARAKDTVRSVQALAAAGGRIAAVVGTCTHRFDVDVFSEDCALRAFGGTVGRGLTPLDGTLPTGRRRDCRREPSAPVSAAAGDGVLAFAETPWCRQLVAARAAAGSRVVIHRAGQRRQVISAGRVRQVRIAGRYLAYLRRTRARSEAVVYDLARRERVRRIKGGDDLIEALDVQADGTVALVRTRSGCVWLARLGEAERRVGCRLGYPEVALAGGRVLYANGTRRGLRLVLAGAGGTRVLAGAAAGRSFGGFDLSPTHATWSIRRGARKPRIVLEQL